MKSRKYMCQNQKKSLFRYCFSSPYKQFVIDSPKVQFSKRLRRLLLTNMQAIKCRIHLYDLLILTLYLPVKQLNFL